MLLFKKGIGDNYVNEATSDYNYLFESLDTAAIISIGVCYAYA